MRVRTRPDPNRPKSQRRRKEERIGVTAAYLHLLHSACIAVRAKPIMCLVPSLSELDDLPFHGAGAEDGETWASESPVSVSPKRREEKSQ
jgi:hypothetical protein